MLIHFSSHVSDLTFLDYSSESTQITDFFSFIGCCCLKAQLTNRLQHHMFSLSVFKCTNSIIKNDLSVMSSSSIRMHHLVWTSSQAYCVLNVFGFAVIISNKLKCFIQFEVCRYLESSANVSQTRVGGRNSNLRRYLNLNKVFSYSTLYFICETLLSN